MRIAQANRMGKIPPTAKHCCWGEAAEFALKRAPDSVRSASLNHVRKTDLAEGGPEKTAALGRPGATPHKDSRIRDFESGVKKFKA